METASPRTQDEPAALYLDLVKRCVTGAVEDYRAQHGITEPIEKTDWAGVFWRRR